MARTGKRILGNRKYAVLLTFCLVSIASLIFILYPELLTGLEEDTGDRVGVHFIDVGQGDSILLAFPGGEYAIVDAGGNQAAQTVVNYLKSLGVERLVFAVGTHPHEDHIGGLDVVLDNFETDVIYMPDCGASTVSYSDLLDVIEEKEIDAEIPDNGEYIYDKNGVSVRVIFNGDGAEGANNCSIILRLLYGNDSLMLSGDSEGSGEKLALKEGYDMSSTLMKAGHHGSSTSIYPAFLDAVSPKYVVISCGKDNEYGHPHEETLEAFAKRRVKVYRTDTSGTVTAYSSGRGWRFSTAD